MSKPCRRLSAIAFLRSLLAMTALGLLAACGGGGGGSSDQPIAQPALATGISVVVNGIGDAFEIGLDAGGNTMVVRNETVGNVRSVIVRKFAADGTALPFGPNGQGVTVDLGGQTPSYVALDRLGNIYSSSVISEQVNDTFLLGFVTVMTGGSIWKTTPDGQSTKLMDWPAFSTGAQAPAYLSVGPDGALYYVDLIAGNLMKWTSQAGPTPLVQLHHFSFLQTFASLSSRGVLIRVDSANRIYLMDGFLLKRLDNGILQVMAGKPVEPGTFDNGQGTSGTQDGAGLQASFMDPTGLAVDSADNVYVADREVIRKVTAAGVVTTVAGRRASGTGADFGDYAPFHPGDLPGSLAFRAGPIALESDKLLRVIVDPNAPNPVAFVPPNKLLVNVKLP